MTAAEHVRMTPAEYLALERASTERHEFHNGEIFAMSGATREHNLCAGNILAELRAALRNRRCEAYGSDMKVRVEDGGRYVYPDVSAVCGGPHFADAHDDVLTNPQLIVEVLSDSTERFDPGDKFALYRGVASIAEVLLVLQSAPRVERYVRQSDGAWLLREYGAGARVPIDVLGCALAVDEIYLKVFRGP